MLSPSRVFRRTPTPPGTAPSAPADYTASRPGGPGTIKLDHRCHVKSVATRRPSWPPVTASTIAPVVRPLVRLASKETSVLWRTERGSVALRANSIPFPVFATREGYADFLLVQREGKTTRRTRRGKQSFSSWGRVLRRRATTQVA